jgi:hypothetical protein
MDVTVPLSHAKAGNRTTSRHQWDMRPRESLRLIGDVASRHFFTPRAALRVYAMRRMH